jgi:hypothetical protein
MRGRDRARHRRAGLVDASCELGVGDAQRVDLAGQHVDQLGHGDEGIGIRVHMRESPFVLG